MWAVFDFYLICNFFTEISFYKQIYLIVISICIPIYNFDVTDLVRELHTQALKLDISFQILLMDDASDAEFRIVNNQLEALNNVKYIQLTTNVGRACIRNKLAETALYSYLIFMDCDSKVKYHDYIARYLPLCQSGIVCSGGREYLDKPNCEAYILHWKAGVIKETFSVKERQFNPNKSFLTCNFLIDKHIFKLVKFDERLKDYGNEDTLFGYELTKNNIIVRHIDNPLYHIGLETSDIYLNKIEKAIQNLCKIDDLLNQDSLFIQSVTLIQTCNSLKKWHLLSLILFPFRFLKKPIRKNLLGKHPNINILDYYKLCYFCTLSR